MYRSSKSGILEPASLYLLTSNVCINSQQIQIQWCHVGSTTSANVEEFTVPKKDNYNQPLPIPASIPQLLFKPLVTDDLHFLVDNLDYIWYTVDEIGKICTVENHNLFRKSNVEAFLRVNDSCLRNERQRAMQWLLQYPI